MTLLKRLPNEPLFKPTRPDNVFGSLKSTGPPKTIEEMDAGVLTEARSRYLSLHRDESNNSQRGKRAKKSK
jgi:hypothetical protein